MKYLILASSLVLAFSASAQSEDPDTTFTEIAQEVQEAQEEAIREAIADAIDDAIREATESLTEDYMDYMDY